jgi:formate/nitrite transporter
MNYCSPREISNNSLQTWRSKASLSLSGMVSLGILAGAYIAFGAEGSTMVAHDIASIGLARLLTGAVFAVGLMMVVIAGGELFTGNILITIGVLNRSVRLRSMLKNWLVVYFANFAGALLVAYLMYASGLWAYNSNQVGVAVLKAAVAKTSLSFGMAFARGILCNWLVCLAVWMAFAGKDVVSKIFGIFFPITLFVSSNFEHSIANMYYIPAGILAKNMPAVVEASHLGTKLDGLTWHNFLFANLVPVTLGNIVGAALFVAFFYWFAYLREESSSQLAVMPAVQLAHSAVAGD